MIKKLRNALLKITVLVMFTSSAYAATTAFLKEAVSVNLLSTYTKSSLFAPPSYSIHYIAPAPWQYWNKANEIVISTNSLIPVSGTIFKSDGTKIMDFSCSANAPFSTRFSGLPKDTPVWPLNTVVNGAGLIVVANASISVNLRNIASDNLSDKNAVPPRNDGSDADIKGNASLFSFGDAAIGNAFRVGYYRDGNIATNETPIYSIMAIENNTIVKIAGNAVATLNKGQSYLFHAAIGTLVESSGPTVMNTSARLDAPGGCGDGAYNPIPPIVSLGNEYVVVRGEGNLIAEQTTVVATEPNTKVTVEYFDVNGAKQKTDVFTLTNPGSFISFPHGFINGTYDVNTNTGRYSSSRITATNNIGVFSGTAGVSGGGGCEVDVATLVPISACSGSKRVETIKFINYTDGDLPYFAYLLTNSNDRIYLTTSGGSTNYTNADIETVPGVGIRKPLQGTGLSLINFTNTIIGSPKVITITSNTRITVSMVQQSSAFSMSNFISRFPEKADQPAIVQTDCSVATLTAATGSVAPYQWYLNGVKIDGATQNTYTAKSSGNYSVTSMLECGLSAQSLPLTISICNIDRAITKTVNIDYPELNSNVVFTLKAENLGDGLATGVSVNDLLPAGFNYVSSSAPAGTTYDPITGVWTIGDLPSKTSLTLTITAKVILSGTNINKATITGQQTDNNPSNDESSAKTITGSLDREVCIGTAIEPISIPVSNNRNISFTGLPNNIVGQYNATTKAIEITGVANVAGTFTYTVNKSGTSGFPKTGKITVNANVGTPVFATDLTSSRCQSAGIDIYTATASNATEIVYTLSPFAAGTINASTGKVTWSPTFTGTATVTATAKGCSEQKKDFIVFVNPLPSLTLAQTEVCLGSTSFDIHYIDPINNPKTYSIAWANNEFPPIVNQILPAGSIPLNIPANASLGEHVGTITLVNDKGCSSSINFTINIKPIPAAPHVQLNINSQY